MKHDKYVYLSVTIFNIDMINVCFISVDLFQIVNMRFETSEYVPSL